MSFWRLLAVGVEADGDVALVSGEAELVGDAGALGGETVRVAAKSRPASESYGRPKAISRLA
jgi:hypothetical protein